MTSNRIRGVDDGVEPRERMVEMAKGLRRVGARGRKILRLWGIYSV
jgi:hypothetical protein